jgi:hypothetical protein
MNKVVKVLGTVFLVGFGATFWRIIFDGPKKDPAIAVQQNIDATIMKVQKTLPRNIDRYFTWIGIERTGLTIDYNIRFEGDINTIKMEFPIDAFKEQKRQLICSEYSLQLNTGYTMHFDYIDKNGVGLGGYDLTKADCAPRQ